MWVLVSVAVAVMLWLLATALERRLELGNEAPLPAEREPVVQEQPVGERATTPPGCEATETRLSQVIAGARACEVDDDCTLFDYGYPMDCMTSVSKSQVPLLREEYRRYDEACDFRVFYDCPTEPYVRLPLCRNNRCVVELDTRHDLQESTLDQLNRRPTD